MGWQNPRQLCGKYMCNNEDMWHRYTVAVQMTVPVVTKEQPASTDKTTFSEPVNPTKYNNNNNDNGTIDYDAEPTIQQLYWLVDNKWTEMD